MKKHNGAATALTLFVVSTAYAQSPRLEILDLHPAPETTLASHEALYARVRYEADRPVRLQARGYLTGSEVPGMTNASPVYPPGEGEALAWVAYERAAIDTLHVRLHDRHWKQIAEVTMPVTVMWTANASRGADPQPAWLDAARENQHQLLAADARRHADDSGAFGLIDLLIWLAAWSVPGYFVLQVVALRKLAGTWRRLAWLPAWAMAPVFAVTLFALLRESNLWPIWLLLASPVACLYFAVLLFAWRHARRAQAAG